MSAGFLARKGEANPAATHHGGESRFQARRVIVLPPIALHREHGRAPSATDVPRRAADMSRPRRAPVRRRKFTFRIAPDRHEKFCDAASRLGISRQELLTRALDSYLDTLRDDAADPPRPTPNRRVLQAHGSHDAGQTLQLPF